MAGLSSSLVCTPTTKNKNKIKKSLQSIVGAPTATLLSLTFLKARMMARDGPTYVLPATVPPVHSFVAGGADHATPPVRPVSDYAPSPLLSEQENHEHPVGAPPVFSAADGVPRADRDGHAVPHARLDDDCAADVRLAPCVALDEIPRSSPAASP